MNNDPQPHAEVTQHPSINTQGGAVFTRDVQAGRDVIGRDQIINNVTITVETPADAARLQAQFQDILSGDFTRQPGEPETIPTPAGEFIMGSAAAPEEAPAHRVALPAYRMGVRPISNREYHEFVQQTGWLVPPTALWNGQSPPMDRLADAMRGVRLTDALAYCHWLHEKTGRNYTLPNEAEWEYATHGVTPGFVWGEIGEWTCSLWGERLRIPDPRYAYPWQDDGRNAPAAGAHLRRVVRGQLATRASARSSSLPDQAGAPGKRLGFRVVLRAAIT